MGADPTDQDGGARDWPPPGFRRFWIGETVSGLGSWVSLLALQTIVVVTLGGGATETGWLNAARWLPYLLVGLVVGALVDRRPRRPVMISTDLVRAALLVAVPAAWWLGVLSLPLLLVLVFGIASATLVNDAASQSFVPRLVPRRHLQRAHARMDGTDAVAQTAGPAIGGLLVKLLGAPIVVLVDAISYLASAVLVATLPTTEPVRTGPTGAALRREVVDGVRWVYRRGGLRDLAVWTHVWFAGQAIMGAVFAPVVLRDLSLSPLWFGLVTAAVGVGGLLGATTSAAVGRRIGFGGAVIASHLMNAVGAALTATAVVVGDGWVVIAPLVLGQVFHGFGLGCSNSHEMTYRQSLTPDGLQARTNTTMRSLNRAVVVVVAPFAGWAADSVGAVPALVVAASIFAAAGIGLASSPFRTARLDPT